MECDLHNPSSCYNCTCCPDGGQFLDEFRVVVPTVFMGVSTASAVSCLLVFITYCSLQRLSGYLPKVLLLRSVANTVYLSMLVQCMGAYIPLPSNSSYNIAYISQL